MEIGLEPKDAVDWSYRGEGAVNLVLAYTGSSPSFLGKMMRIQKMPNDGKEDNGNTSGNGLTSHEKVIWGECKEVVSCQNKEIVEFLFVKHVMRPLLGHKHVNPGMRLLVAKEFLESVENIVTSQRPSWRADAACVDTNRNSVLLMDDLTLFAHGRVEDKPCLSVEIKPKCGFLPSSSFIAQENVIKKGKTRFEMHQVLKLQENEISEISEYDPLDLFSGSKDRIHKAIRALYATPQNNFRVFLNGSLVFGGLGGGTCKTTSKVEQDFEHILKDIIKTKDGPRANHFIELVAETVYTSGVLDHLLDVQKLDKYNIEGAIHVYYDLINQPCKVCKELEKSTKSSASQFSSMHLIPMDEKVNVLKEFLISATAKDCSVMISFRSTNDVISRSSSHSNLHLESAKQEFDYKVHFIDLDMRPLKKMEVYYELDKKIMKTYLEMMKKKEALLGGERRAQRQCF
ncbi:inositol-pentakisphosphate 2-kinase [Raphanus sativus]|uniref:Inositol-pentakisphosphate 2-kinase n=1 Tax=Raphanus sativus TaxID=3726 RepID=A0A6J0KHS1_RAPSA|nr:inositol-pentakisphosphate 2-kinase [Raphanus sativus]